MNIKSFLLNFLVGLLTFAIGSAWFGVYRFFAASSISTDSAIREIKENEHAHKPSPVKNAALDAEIKAVQKATDAVKRAADAAKDAEPKAVFDEQKSDGSEDDSDDKFRSTLEIEGYYESVNRSKDIFDDLRMEIWLGVYSEETGVWIDGPPSGFIEFKNKFFEFQRFHYSKGRLSFSTVKRDGESFVFNGEYEKRTRKNGDGYEYEDPVLSGKLIRSKDGKIIDKAEVEFTWYVGC